LPVALAIFLRQKGLDCQHVLDVGLRKASDAEIPRYAAETGRIIISKDDDFFYLASVPTAQFRLLWVRRGNCRTLALLRTFEEVWPKVEAALNAGEQIIEIR
jgi:predicted nuclease of predicted toxin-antitoxin system